MGAYSARVIADGASYYWRLNEPSGTVAADSVGGLAGTISGPVTLNAPGALADADAAMAFATNGTIRTASPGALVAPYSVELWVRLTALASTACLVSTRNAGTGTGTAHYLLASGVLALYSDPLAFSASGSRVLSLGAWHHVVFVLTGTALLAYLDGTPDTMTPSAFVSPGSAGHPVELAADSAGVGSLVGSLDEVAIYPRVLTAPEVAAHYALASAVAVAPARGTSSLGYWKQVWPAA